MEDDLAIWVGTFVLYLWPSNSSCLLKKENPKWWEEEIKNFIKNITSGNYDKWLKLLKNIDIFLCEKQLKRYKKYWYEDSAKLIESVLKDIDYLFTERENWKTRSAISWIKSDLIPNRYFEWSTNNWILNEIKEKNTKSLAQALSWRIE